MPGARTLLLALLAVAPRCLLLLAAEDEETCPAGSDSSACRQGGRGSTGASASAFGAPAPAPVPQADLITQEVEELQHLIRLSEARIGVLKELQGAVSDGGSSSVPEAHLRVLREKLPLMSEIAADAEKLPSAAAEDYLVSRAVIPLEDAMSFVKFLPLRNPRSASSSSSSTAVAMPSTLLVVSHTDGTVRLFTPSGDLVLTFQTGHEHPVTHLTTSPAHDEYLITTGDAAGFIRVHKVTVRQRRLSKDQKQARRSSMDEKVSQYLGSSVNVTAQLLKQMRVPAGSNGESATMTALAMASQQGSKYFVAGDTEGKVSVFSKNGTLRAKIDTTATPGASIEGLHVHLSSLVFRAGDEWGYIDLERLEARRIECPKFEGRVTSAVIDSQQASRVIVTDEDGTLVVFNVKNKRDCKVELRFPKGTTRAPIDIASVRGFVIGVEQPSGAGDPASVLALNMSRALKKKGDMAAPSSAVVWRRQRTAVRSWAVHKRYQQGDLLAFLSEDGREIEIVELLMQVYTPPVADSFKNFKLPVIAVAIVLVLGYQLVKQKGRLGGGLGGKKVDWGANDFSAALKSKRKLAGMKAKKF